MVTLENQYGGRMLLAVFLKVLLILSPFTISGSFGDVGEWLKLTSCHIAYRVSGKHIFTSTSSIKNSEDRVSQSLGKMLDLVTTVQLSNCCGALSL